MTEFAGLFHTHSADTTRKALECGTIAAVATGSANYMGINILLAALIGLVGASMPLVVAWYKNRTDRRLKDLEWDAYSAKQDRGELAEKFTASQLLVDSQAVTINTLKRRLLKLETKVDDAVCVVQENQQKADDIARVIQSTQQQVEQVVRIVGGSSDAIVPNP